MIIGFCSLNILKTHIDENIFLNYEEGGRWVKFQISPYFLRPRFEQKSMSM